MDCKEQETTNSMNNEQKVQGDVMFIRVDKLPEEFEANKKILKNIVLAHGESGNKHQLQVMDRPDTSFEIYEKKSGEFYLRLASPAEVVHEEHGTIQLDTGMYLIRRQREYDPLIMENRQERQVQD